MIESNKSGNIIDKIANSKALIQGTENDLFNFLSNPLNQYNDDLSLTTVKNNAILLDFVSAIDKNIDYILHNRILQILDNPKKNKYIKLMQETVEMRKITNIMLALSEKQISYGTHIIDGKIVTIDNEKITIDGEILDDNIFKKWEKKFLRVFKFENELIETFEICFGPIDTDSFNTLGTKNDLSSLISKNSSDYDINNVFKTQAALHRSIENFKKRYGVNDQAIIEKYKHLVEYYENLYYFELYSDIKIDVIEPSNGSTTMSYKQIFKEIRNGIAHAKYTISDDGIYIDNPPGNNHGKAFKCKVKRDDMRKICLLLKTQSRCRTMLIVENIKEIDFSKGIEEILNNIKIMEHMENLGVILSENMKEMLKSFFKKYTLNERNLYFALYILAGEDDIFQSKMLNIIEHLQNGTIDAIKEGNEEDIDINLYKDCCLHYTITSILAKYYINNIPSSPRGTPTENISLDEHRRNAFAHGNFAILPGVDDILLRDPPQNKKSPMWEERVSLKSLYTDYLKEVKKS